MRSLRSCGVGTWGWVYDAVVLLSLGEREYDTGRGEAAVQLLYDEEVSEVRRIPVI